MKTEGKTKKRSFSRENCVQNTELFRSFSTTKTEPTDIFSRTADPLNLESLAILLCPLILRVLL